MSIKRWVCCAGITVLLMAVVTTAWADQQDRTWGPYGPGRGMNAWFNEWDRLSRHAYDYDYRNSNNNVYRNSRHFSPLQNIFRSSRYYQQQLRAATDGYPIRSTARVTEQIGDRKPFVRSYSWMYPDPYPFRHYGYLPPWTQGGYDPAIAHSINRNLVRAADIQWNRPTATDTPIVQKYMLPSGRKVTIVVSMPPEVDADDAWQLLAAGASNTAAHYFERFTDGARGVQARLGMGLALAESGDTDAAARQLDMAVGADPSVIGDPSQWAPLQPVLGELLVRLEGQDDATATVRRVVSEILGQTDLVDAE
jgi:hypothetical protein